MSEINDQDLEVEEVSNKSEKEKENNPDTNESPSKQEIVIPNNDKISEKKVVEKAPKKVEENKENLKNLSSRAYLESTVVPTVMQGMAELANKKPDNPLEWLGNYIIKASKK